MSIALAAGRGPVAEHCRLAWDLARRDLSAKYKRSLIGPLWLLFTPLCLLGIYWLVFGLVFGVQWKGPHAAGADPVGFVLPFFVGLVLYLAVTDVVNSSAVLFTSKRTYVVKSPFPIWVLWLSNLMRASVHAAVGLVLVVLLALAQWRLSPAGVGLLVTGVALCVVFIAALSLVLASVGPFIGDISDAMRLLLRVLFYATPITYPISLIPPPWQQWLWLNPLTCMVELLRSPIVFGTFPPAGPVLGFSLATALLAMASAWMFARLKGVIPDVV